MTAATEPGAIHLDAVGGIAGDMFVAGLLDAFPHLEARVMADLAALLPAEAGRPVLSAGESGGLRVRRFGLEAPAQKAHHHHHGHEHAHHDHHHGTAFAALRTRIAGARLSAGTAEAAIGILTLLAGAEAKMHGVAIEAVHFHELADWDSLMDVVAAGSIVAALGPIDWSVSPLPRGAGLVKTQHGLLPVPAPATAELLTGFALRDDGIGGERVTPTGAAIVKFLVDPARAPVSGRLVATGMGAGTRTLPGMPNILRVLGFAAEAKVAGESVVVLSFEIDDMTGEEIGIAAERLRATEGVLDVVLAAVSGKKSRPATQFQLLVRPGHEDAVGRACLLQTSTIGLRLREEQRMILPRVLDGGPDARIKRVTRPDGTETIKAESDDLASGETLAERRRLARQREKE